MDYLLVLVVLFVFGSIFGSFAGAQLWRLRARQLKEDDTREQFLKSKTTLSDDEQQELGWLAAESAMRKSDRKTLNDLIGPVSQDYSRCLHCGHRLNWYDLLPVLSWLLTRGRCRYCKNKIGRFEILIELGLALSFVMSFILWPLELTNWDGVLIFILWLGALIAMSIIFAYDVKWFLVPDGAVVALTAIAIIISLMRVRQFTSFNDFLLSLLISTFVLSGIYLALWRISDGKWVGFGDVKLGAGLAVLLLDWKLALLALITANLIGSLVVIPGLLLGSLKRKDHIPFGPLLIVGAVIAFLSGKQIIDWYLSIFLY